MGSDMVVALPRATVDGRTLFAHNASWPGAEGPVLVRVEGRQFAGETLTTGRVTLRRGKPAPSWRAGPAGNGATSTVSTNMAWPSVSPQFARGWIANARACRGRTWYASRWNAHPTPATQSISSLTWSRATATRTRTAASRPAAVPSWSLMAARPLPSRLAVTMGPASRRLGPHASDICHLRQDWDRIAGRLVETGLSKACLVARQWQQARLRPSGWARRQR